MKTATRHAICWLVVAMFVVPAGAATLGPGQTGYPILRLTPSEVTVNVGESFTVELTIEGFADAEIAGLSEFSVGIGTAPSFFELQGYTLGTTLGDPALGESVDTSLGQVGDNTFFLGQSSNLPADYLSAQLPDSIVLATLVYTASGALGICSCVVISASPQLFDAYGDSFMPNVINAGVRVTVVPLPGAVWLLLAGLAVVPRKRCAQRAHD